MVKAFQLLFSTGFWAIVSLLFGIGVADIFGLKVLPIVALIFAFVGTLFPKVFAMGVEGFRKANILSKLMPLVYVALIAIGVSMIRQTYSSAFFISVLLGNTTSYLSFVLLGGEVQKKRKKKGAK